MKEWFVQFELKLQSYLDMKLRISEEEASKLGRKDQDQYPSPNTVSKNFILEKKTKKKQTKQQQQQ